MKDNDQKLIWEAYLREEEEWDPEKEKIPGRPRIAMAHAKGAWEKGLAMEFIEMWHGFYEKYGTQADAGERDKLLYPLIKDKVSECYNHDKCDANAISSHLAEQPWEPTGASEGVATLVRQALTEISQEG